MSSMIVESVYDHLQQKAKAERLTELLRHFKGQVSDDIRISAPRKEGLISNIREAVDANFIPRDALYDVIRDCEENGDQKLFLYLPASADVEKRVSDPGYIQEAIWGDPGKRPPLPNFTLEKESFVWADFRVEHWPGDQVGWRGKLYGHETRWEQVGEPEIRGDLKKVSYIQHPDRPVIVVRWRPVGVLEIRIPRSDSIKRTNQHFEAAWRFFQKAFRIDQFKEWCLRAPRTRLLQERAANAGVYLVAGLKLLDPETAKVSFESQTTYDTIDQHAGTSEALEALLKGDSDCRELVVTWLGDGANGALDGDLRTLIGSPVVSNMISISRTTTSGAIDYVVDRLRALDERTS